MVFLSNYLNFSKLYFKNHFKHMDTSISVIILVLHIYTEKSAILSLRKKNLKKVKD